MPVNIYKCSILTLSNLKESLLARYFSKKTWAVFVESLGSLLEVNHHTHGNSSLSPTIAIYKFEPLELEADIFFPGNLLHPSCGKF